MDLQSRPGRKCVKPVCVSECVVPVGAAWMDPWGTSSPDIRLNCPPCHKAGRGHLLERRRVSGSFEMN